MNLRICNDLNFRVRKLHENSQGFYLTTDLQHQTTNFDHHCLKNYWIRVPSLTTEHLLSSYRPCISSLIKSAIKTQMGDEGEKGGGVVGVINVFFKNFWNLRYRKIESLIGHLQSLLPIFSAVLPLPSLTHFLFSSPHVNLVAFLFLLLLPAFTWFCNLHVFTIFLVLSLPVDYSSLVLFLLEIQRSSFSYLKRYKDPSSSRFFILSLQR